MKLPIKIINKLKNTSMINFQLIKIGFKHKFASAVFQT